ncbi:hypothetical protein L916_20404 [Phytophthora nicotianae]|uniref:Uncharacterized protein n=1 Tax=Phytophthora nicotianae TaxID=4792 RepID=W2HXD0_PHYNI|nr:hypothetical protein L916_20404 [Phytophthora nicotianae]
MLKWLAAGPVVCEGLKKGLLYGNLLSDAAGGGSMGVLEYVCNLSLTDNSGEALVDLAKRPGPSSPLASVYRQIPIFGGFCDDFGRDSETWKMVQKPLNHCQISTPSSELKTFSKLVLGIV